MVVLAQLLNVLTESPTQKQKLAECHHILKNATIHIHIKTTHKNYRRKQTLFVHSLWYRIMR